LRHVGKAWSGYRARSGALGQIEPELAASDDRRGAIRLTCLPARLAT